MQINQPLDQQLEQLVDECSLRDAQCNFLRRFLEAITLDLRPKTIYNTIVNEAAVFLGRDVTLLYLFDLKKTIASKDIDINFKDKVLINGTDINLIKGMEPREAIYEEVEIRSVEKNTIIKSAVTYPLLDKDNKIIGLICVGNINSGLSEEEDKKEIEERLYVVSKAAGSMIKATLNLENELDEHTNRINELKKKVTHLRFKRITGTLIGITIATIITMGVMYVVRMYGLKVSENDFINGLDLFYGMAGFSLFFAITAVSFRLITEIKFGDKSISAHDNEKN